MNTKTRIWLYLAQFFLEWKIFQVRCRENQNTRFRFNNFFQTSCHLWDNVEKYGTAGQATDDKMAHVQCILDT